MATPPDAQAWLDSLCRKPKPVRLKPGKVVTLLCMRDKGHDGECMEALAVPEDK